jgi:flagellar hook-associated protein FlgK
MDVKANPKTGENVPDADAAVVSRVTERLKEIVFSINDIILFVKDNSSLSHDSLDKCVNEINSYISALESEKQDSIIN